MTVFDNIQIEKRLHVSRLNNAIAVLIAILVALLISITLIWMAGANITLAFQSLYEGAFGGKRRILETLVQAVPLIFTGLAMTIAFRAKVWNIGAEGQLYAGAILATGVSMYMGNFPQWVAIIILILMSLLGGAIWGGIAGFIKVKFGVSEIIITVLMNFLISYLLSYLLSGPWQDPSSFYYQSKILPESTIFPTLYQQSRLHLGFPLSIVLSFIVYVILRKTPFGFEVRALGGNPKAAEYKGVNTQTMIIIVMALSGGIAGLAGGSELAGIHHRLRLNFSTGYGFMGIPVALLARENPLLVILIAIFFGALINGSTGMQIATGVPTALIQALQGIILICVLTAEWLTKYRIRIRKNAF